MAIFEIETPEGKFEIDAPDMQTALRAIGAGDAGHKDLGMDMSKVPAGYNPQTGEVEKTGASDKTGAFLTGFADLPIVGPGIKAGQRNIAAAMAAPFSDQTFGEIRDQMGKRQEEVVRDNPGTALAGNLTGTVASFIPAGATSIGARLLGITGRSLGRRMAASGLSSAAISGGDAAVRGASPEGITGSAAIGGGIGAAIPGAGALIRAGLSAGGDMIAPTLNAIRNPVREAERRVGVALNRDAVDPANMISAADEAAAGRAGLPLLNVDRGGETTRALARSVANQSPEARAVIERTANDRFAGQGERIARTISRLMGGQTDDLLMVAGIRDAAASSNRGAYNRAYTAPAAQDMWNEGFEQLMQAPAMQRAARLATGRGANRAAVEGFQPVRNPFEEVNGRLTLRRNADGSIARPTLQFWDQVKRNLDSDIGKAQRTGDRTLAADLTALRGRLVSMLDERVPEFRDARRGAAAFFGAEDAVEAGRAFARSSRMIPEYQRGILAMNAAEREAFATGYSSEIIDAARNGRDRVNVVERLFGSPEARQKLTMVLGRERAQEVEAFVRVERLADQLRGAMGNSTTARQLMELGIGAGGGLWATGDWKGAALGALAARGARVAGQRVDNRVMREVGRLLTSNDRRSMRRAAMLAARNPRYMRALEQWDGILGSAARGTVAVGQ